MKPKLRFKEFTDDWEEKQLGDFMIFANGINTDKSNYGIGRKMISVLDVLNDSKLLLKNIINSVSVPQEIEKKYKVTYGDVLFVRSSEVISEVGLCKGYIDKENYSLYSGFIIRGKQSIYHPIILQNIINTTTRREIEKQSGGSTRYNISQSILKNIKIQLPSLPEQEKIGAFLSLVDQRIEKAEKKVSLLKEEKKGWMQKLFQQEIRFKDEQGNDYPDWEEKKLGDIGDTFTSLSGKTKEDFGHGDAKFITFVNVLKNTIAKVEEVDNIEIDKKQNEVLYGDFMFTTSSETPEEVGMSSLWLSHDKNVYLNSFCFGYRLNSYYDISYRYMAYLLRSKRVRKQFIKLAQGISRYNISKTKAMDIIIPLPSLPEQEKIAKFLSLLDQRIEKEERKVELLKEEKKGLLQQMFV